MQASRFFGWLSVALAVSTAAACGDDTGSGGAGGSGGEPSNTTSTTTSAKSSTSTTTTSSSSTTTTTTTTNTTDTTTTSTGGGGMAEGGGGGDGGGGGMQGNASQQIADVLATPDGGGLTLPIQGALVTYTKPLLGMDAAGFFLQADQAGPAIFVAVDPATLTPAPEVGDEVDLTVTDVATSASLKQVTALTGFSVVSSNNSIAPLVADVNNATDLVTNLDAYAARVITLDADIDVAFTAAGAPQVAAVITTMGVDDPNLRLRMPETVRAAYDLQPGCAVTLDYGVMWRFNAVAQPSALQPSDLTLVLCPAPTVVSAIALSSTSVQVTFDRTLDAASVQAADFTFNNGLTAQNVSVSGATVTVTTSAQAGGTYTVTAANLDDVLGSPVVAPNNTAMFSGFVSAANLVINEINPNITGSTDLVELLVTGAGSTNGITLLQDGTNVETIATLPDVNVAAGDLIVIHITPAAATGAAPSSELTSKTQFANASFSANYDNAWDFHGGTTGLTNNNRVIRLEAPGGVVLDAVPFAITSGTPPAAFPGDLQALQAAGFWLPANCGGAPCDYVSTPTAIGVSVLYTGVGNSATTNSVQRKLGFDTMQASDWNAAAAQTWGQPNP